MSETNILAAVHGIAPRSDQLLLLGGDVARGRAPQAEYDAQLSVESAEWLELQQVAGIDLRENGKLRWQDHLRPIVKASTGFAEAVDEAPVSRWFDTNTFYRRPTILGELIFDIGAYERLSGPVANYVSLLEPDSFAQLCENQADQTSRLAVRSLYSQIVGALEERGVREVAFESYPSQQTKLFGRHESLDFLADLAEQHPQVEFGIVEPTTNDRVLPADHHPPNLSLDAGFATFNSHDHISPLIRIAHARGLAGRQAWVQVVDASTTAPDDITTEDWDLLSDLRLERLVLTHSVDLERLPLKYAQEKIKYLGALTDALRQKVAGL